VLLEDRIGRCDRQVNSTSVPNGNTSRPLHDNRKGRSLRLLAAGHVLGATTRLDFLGLAFAASLIRRDFPPTFRAKADSRFFSLQHFIKFIVHFARYGRLASLIGAGA
jgi:hypothetical protein